MVALFTRTRGNETGNPLAMIGGFIAVAILSNLPNDLWKMVAGGALYQNPAWLPVVEFPWRILIGTLVTVAIALCFKTPAMQPERNQ
jgi:Na+/proline symporter